MSESFISPPLSDRRLSFLRRNSSGRRRNTSCTKKDKGNVDPAQYEKEITELRKRVQTLDSGMGRTELLDRLQEKEEEIRKKDKQLHGHNDKFHEINNGLTRINEEREKLKQKVERLEKEKKDLQRRLDIREKEVLSLVRRCSSQEERLKGSASLRTSTKDLVKEVEDLKSKLKERDDALLQMVELQRELSETQDEKEVLQGRLAMLKKDHEAVTDNFNTSLAKIQKLTENQSETEDERRREQQRAELELEQQRLDHLQVTNQLKDELQKGEDDIMQVEKTIREHAEKNKRLNDLMNEWEKRRENDMNKLREDHDKEKRSITKQHQEEVKRLQNIRDGTAEYLQSELEAKERVVLTLETEISKCMEKMMSLSSDLQSLKEDKDGEGSQLAQAIEKLELERRTLGDQLSLKETEVIELTGTLCRFESDNILMKQELLNLQDRFKNLQSESTKSQELDIQLRTTVTSLNEAKRQKALAEEKSERAVTTIKRHLEEQNQMWISMEKGLQERISGLERENTAQAEEHENVLKDYRAQISAMEKDMDNRSGATAKIQEQLKNERREAAERHQSSNGEIERLRTSLEKVTGELVMKEDEIRELKLFDLKDSEDTITHLRDEVRMLKQQLKTKEGAAAKSASNLEAQIEQLEMKAFKLERSLSDAKQQHSQTVDRLEEESSGLQAENSALESEAKSHLTKLKELHVSKTALARENTLLDERNLKMEVEIKQLKADKEKAIVEHEKLVAAMQREIHVIRINREDEDLINENKCAKLEEELSRANDMLKCQRERTKEVEEILETRTKLLADMVTYNKGVEENLEKERAEKGELESKLGQYKSEKKDAEADVNRLAKALKDKEDQFLEDVHNERHLREIAEADLEHATKRLNSSVRGTKELSELEKENSDLKDKVKRQEAYLKRKLKRDKVLRDRSNGAKTPLQNSTSRIKNLRKTGGSGSSRSFSIPESSSFPDEWESNSIY